MVWQSWMSITNTNRSNLFFISSHSSMKCASIWIKDNTVLQSKLSTFSLVEKWPWFSLFLSQLNHFLLQYCVDAWVRRFSSWQDFLLKSFCCLMNSIESQWTMHLENKIYHFHQKWPVHLKMHYLSQIHSNWKTSAFSIIIHFNMTRFILVVSDNLSFCQDLNQSVCEISSCKIKSEDGVWKWESIIDNNNETAYPEAHNEWTTWIPPLNFWVLFGLDLWSVNLLDEHIVVSLILHSFDYWCVHLSSMTKYRDRQIFCI